MTAVGDRIELRVASVLTEARLTGVDLREAFQAVHPGDGPESWERFLSELRIECADVSDCVPSLDVLRALPAEMIRVHQALPIEWADGVLRVAVPDPTDQDLILDLHIAANAPIRTLCADRNALEDAIQRLLSPRGGGRSGFVDFTAGAGKGIETPEKRNTAASVNVLPPPNRRWMPAFSQGGGLSVESPIIRLVNEIISEAIHSHASDIHFEPYERDLKVRLRQDGVLRVHRTLPLRSKAEVLSRLKVMAGLDIAERRRPQDGRIRMLGDGQGIDVRVSTLPTEHGEKVVLRILDKGAVPLDLSQLGMSRDQREVLEKALMAPYGMILMTGPTGAGKTTTLYSCLNRIRSPEVNIVTVEDPIEVKLEGVIQSAVKPEVDYTFANALRTILRQDPNVILVGEIRDQDTAEIAVRAALTGHLVLSTLHTNDAPGAVARLLDMGIEPFLLASALTLVGGQRLVRRVCPRCAQPSATEEATSTPAGASALAPLFAPKGKGCPACSKTGYSGRVALYEFMPITEALRTLIGERRDTSRIRAAAVAEGMVGLREDGMAKARSGLTSLEEVLRETA